MKESGRSKAFSNRVFHILHHQGWTVEKQPRGSIVDIIATHPGGLKRAFKIKAHGHLTRGEIQALHNYEHINNIAVVYIHESESEILFSRMYKHIVNGKVK